MGWFSILMSLNRMIESGGLKAYHTIGVALRLGGI